MQVYSFMSFSRFIPACAGNSASALSSTTAPPVHPRVCGELYSFETRGDLQSGSSPRVRGTLGERHEGCAIHRFIPACAGNSRRMPARAMSCTVHPRVCGELSVCVTWMVTVTGSSPRVRGTLTLLSRASAMSWFIPACAGNSRMLRAPSGALSVHPRVCGELLASYPPSPLGGGSSPRVRGTLPRSFGVATGKRFIPACAGNSKGGDGTAITWAVHPRVCGELAESSSIAS